MLDSTFRGARRAAAATLCLCTIAAAPAQTIYRCGGDARQLSDRPCAAQDHPLSIDVDRPDEARRQQAADVAAREAQLAQQLRAERQAREAEPAAGAAGFHGAAKAKPASEVRRTKKGTKNIRVKPKPKKRLKAPAEPATAPGFSAK